MKFVCIIVVTVFLVSCGGTNAKKDYSERCREQVEGFLKSNKCVLQLEFVSDTTCPIIALSYTSKKDQKNSTVEVFALMNFLKNRRVAYQVITVFDEKNRSTIFEPFMLKKHQLCLKTLDSFLDGVKTDYSGAFSFIDSTAVKRKAYTDFFEFFGVPKTMKLKTFYTSHDQFYGGGKEVFIVCMNNNQPMSFAISYSNPTKIMSFDMMKGSCSEYEWNNDSDMALFGNRLKLRPQ